MPDSYRGIRFHLQHEIGADSALTTGSWPLTTPRTAEPSRATRRRNPIPEERSWREGMVEAGGVEPPSEAPKRRDSPRSVRTCFFNHRVFRSGRPGAAAILSFSGHLFRRRR